MGKREDIILMTGGGGILCHVLRKQEGKPRSAAVRKGRIAFVPYY